VIAEGIENPTQLQRLRTLGCEYGQGFLFSKPLTAPETRALLSGSSPAWAAALGDVVESPGGDYIGGFGRAKSPGPVVGPVRAVPVVDRAGG